ncbi:MAG: D-glycerate dehydrogenase [Bacillota bacterium]
MTEKWNVYITRQITEPALELLREHCRVEVNPYGRPLTKEEMLEAVRGRDAVLCLLNDDISEGVLEAARGAKIFANYAVGYDNLDVAAATQRGILLSNTPGVLTDSTADIAFGLLMAVARRIAEADKWTRAGKFKGWGPMDFLGQEITGKTLGIVGGGRIGQKMAKRGRGFDMKIIYTGRRKSPDFEEATGGIYVTKEELLKEADFISLHVPLTPETRHYIGEKELKLMKKSAILINTARGPVVDEKALVEALKTGEIWGAGLDVYEEEPLLAPGLAQLANAVLVPHIGSATWETRTKMGLMAAENILSALRGKLPPNCLNPEIYQ